MAAAVTSVGLVGAIYAVRDTRSADPATAADAGSVAESPLVETAEDMSISSPVKPGALALQLSNGKHVTFAITGTEYWDGYAQQATIQFDGYAIGRIHEDAGEIDLIPVPEIGGNDDMVYWTGVPTDATRVELRTGDGTVRWQVPIDGITAFPITTHDQADVMVALDAAGNEVGRAAWADTVLIGAGDTDGVTKNLWSSNTLFDTWHTDVASQFSNLTQRDEDEYRSFANNTMHQCLTDNGDAA